MTEPMRHTSEDNCNRLALHALADGQLDPQEATALTSHLATCTTCRDELESIKVLGAEIRAQLPIHTAPDYLRQRIESARPKGRRKQRWHFRFRPLVGIAAAGWLLAVVAVLFIGWQHYSEKHFPAPAFVEDHVNYLRNRELAQVSVSDAASLERWFSERVDFHPSVPRLANATLLGGRVCKVAGERVVLAFWQHRSDTVTVFARKDSNALDFSSMQEIQAGGRKLRATSAEGYNLLLWRENGLLYVLVTDHPQHDLANYAKRLFA